MKENPRYNVVSLRVSDDELEVLEAVTRATSKNMSQVLREALLLVVPPRTCVAGAEAKR